MVSGVSEDFKIDLQEMKDVEEITEIIKNAAFGVEPLNLYHLKVALLGKDMYILVKAHIHITSILHSLSVKDPYYDTLTEPFIKRAMIVCDGSLLMLSDFIGLVEQYGDPILIPLH